VTRLLGAVLAGGQSSRFGSDKALALWQGKPLLEHVTAALRPMVADLVLCGRSHGGIAGIADRPRAGMGPLGGLNAALHHAQANGFKAVLIAGCDTPRLPAALLERLRAAPGPAYVADVPVIGCWPAWLADSLDAFLAEDRKHAVRIWAEAAGAEPIDWPALVNVNRPDDLEGLEL
jgi:molybdopterin-guanine dinucleotide biosynthesis protein A